MKHVNNCNFLGNRQPSRHGTTLIIVIALLGLLSLTGMVFYTFATQEHSAAENFAEAAKENASAPDNVWDHMLRQVIVGPGETEKGSILFSERARHSMVRNLVGSDIYPNTGDGVDVQYNAVGVPETIPAPGADNLLDLVDSPAARDGAVSRATPEPDVDYTYPNINHAFLAYRGWAIRDNWELDVDGDTVVDPEEDLNGNGVHDQTAIPRYTQVPVIIPSFFRPQYMKSAALNRSVGASNFSVVADPYWAYATDGGGNKVAITSGNRHTVLYPQRSFRPHPLHVAGQQDDGTLVLRYLTDDEATTLGVASGGFPFIPENNLNALGDATIQGELGVLTGADPSIIELDVDSDGDGIKEGVWLDLRYPVQQHTDSGGSVTNYVVLHSVTIYDLDGLFNLNVHGNLTGLSPNGNQTLDGATTAGVLTNSYISRSNLGLGPNEINPLWGLRRFDAGVIDFATPTLPPPRYADHEYQFQRHFGRAPVNEVEQANMEWIYLKFGRAQYDSVSGNFEDLLTGTFGDANLLYAALENRPTPRMISELPRPGIAGDVYSTIGSGISFGGRDGFDDNLDRLEGEPVTELGKVRPFVHPLDYSGAGRHYASDYPTYNSVSEQFDFPAPSGELLSDPRVPLLLSDPATYGPERWRAYIFYHRASTTSTTSPPRYWFGPDGVATDENGNLPSGTSGDDLNHLAVADALFEDPLEVIFDAARADRNNDDIFTASDLPALHLADSDLTNAIDDISTRVTDLAGFAFDTAQSWNGADNDKRELFTTLSNTLRHFGLQRDTRRAWEFSADTDGPDNNDDGYREPDGFVEFPPRFYTDTDASGDFDAGAGDVAVQPFGPEDPFRPQVRRLLMNEIGDSSELLGSLPLSLNHILDFERMDQTPASDTVAHRRLIQRANMRFRSLTEHPDSSEGTAVLDETSIPLYQPDITAVPQITTLPAFPPTTVGEREFWARRDRQQLARDIYVLLYTIGGARLEGGIGPAIKDYTGTNNPNLTQADSTAAANYSHAQLRTMAQFAVNMVDAMDTDNVITRFEYDKNLGDGWNLDDNAFTNSDDQNTAVGTDATARGLYPDDTDGRGVVYGVEAQQIAFSEVLGIRSAETTSDHLATPYDDSTEVRDFLFLELQNMLPQSLDLATDSSTTAATAVWRVARYERPVEADPVESALSPDRAIAILNHDHNVIDGGGRFSLSVASDPGLGTSSFFLDLGTAGAFDSTYELIVPDATPSALPVAPSYNVAATSDPAYDPLTDIDVLHQDHSSKFEAVGGNFVEAIDDDGTPGDDVYDGNEPFNNLDQSVGDLFTPLATTPLADHSDDGFDVVLHRRQNPHMPSLSEADNPWIEVDRIRMLYTDFNIADGDLPTTLFDDSQPVGSRGKVEHIRATERGHRHAAADPVGEPLDDSLRMVKDPASVVPDNERGLVRSAKTVTQYRYHTIKGESTLVTDPKDDVLGINWSKLPDPALAASITNAAVPFQLWQPHFDRDYASPAELLNLPLYGPRILTQRLERGRLSPYQQMGGAGPANPDDPTIPPLFSTATSMFLMPDFTNASVPAPTNEAAIDNRWYRLLQFVEVPSRVHRMLGNYLTLERLPGKLNINMLRHLEVFAGLVDDPMFADADDSRIAGPFLTGKTPGDAGRDRWHELINERDGAVFSYYDPTPGDKTNSDDGWARFWIPGTPNSRPFRSLSHLSQTGADDNGLDETILRRMASDRTYHQTTNPFGESPDVATTNRQWMEVGSAAFHDDPDSNGGETTTTVQRHQLLSKIMNNTTTVSNCFIVFATVGYFEAYEDPTSGFWQVGGRIDLEGADDANPGWDQRAVFVIDRTELLNAYDEGTGDFDWERLVQYRADIE